jgi:hypothetical protein
MHRALIAVLLLSSAAMAQTPPSGGTPDPAAQNRPPDAPPPGPPAEATKPADNPPPGNTASPAPHPAAKDAPAAGVMKGDDGCSVDDAAKHIDEALAAIHSNPARDKSGSFKKAEQHLEQAKKALAKGCAESATAQTKRRGKPRN